MVHDLYQETILDHSKRPRNCHPMLDATRQAEGYNPLCGDKLKLYLKMEGDFVKDVSFVGSGCAISTASASLMSESLKGKTREEALELLDKFHELLTTDTEVSKDLGKLVVFCGVREYPARVK
jgi:nitrogen fixation NifU-like protein